MIRRIGAILLLVPAGPGAAAVSEAVLRRAIDIGPGESSHGYGCVAVDTNGKLSVALCRNAGRAARLVQRSRKSGPGL